MAILLIVLQSLLALMFLMAGVSKLSGSKMHVENFKQWGLPQWFRVVAGIVEFAGAAALIVGYWDKNWTAVGSLILGITSIGGIIVHIRNKDSFKQTFPILLLAIISFIVFFIR
jgi:putative oxidoreductase